MGVWVGKPALSSILLLSLLLSARIKCITGGINRPLESALYGDQRTVSVPNDLVTDIVTDIYYITELDQTTIRETTSVPIGTTETRTTLLDNTLLSSSQSPSATTTGRPTWTTLTDIITDTYDITSEATTKTGTPSLDNTLLSSSQSPSPFTSTNRNPDVQTSSEHFPTDDSKITSPHRTKSDPFTTSMSPSLASRGQSSTPLSMIPTRVRPTERPSTLAKTESMTTEFQRTDALRTEPRRTEPLSNTENGNPGTDRPPFTEKPSIWHNPTFIALFSLALSTVFLTLIMLIICCIICQQMKDTSKREETYNRRFTALQMHTLRRVGPTPVGYSRAALPLQALPKSEMELGYVSEHNWDDTEISRPGVPVIAWL